MSMLGHNNQQLTNVPLCKEAVDFVRENATSQECAYLDLYLEKASKGEVDFDGSRRFTNLALKYGYFESDLFFDHLSEMQPLLSRLLSEFDDMPDNEGGNQ